MPTEDERSAIPEVLASIADALGIRLEIPDVLPGRSATFATVTDLSGVCPLCAAERASGRGDWTYDLAELPQGGASVRLRDGHYVCSNVGCPAMRTGSVGLAPEAWVTRLSGGEPLWERWRAQWEVEMGKATNVVRLDGSVVAVDLDGEPIEPSPPPQDPKRPLPRRFSPDLIRNPVRDTFVIGQMIPFGKSSVLYGPSSAGKTTLESQIAFAFALGWESLWGLPLAPSGGPVLIYTLEDTYNDWHLKAAAFCRAHGVAPEALSKNLYIIAREEGFARFTESVQSRRKNGDELITNSRHQETKDQKWLIEDALAVGAKFILVETASRLVEKEDNEGFSVLQSALGHIAQVTGAATIVSHHSTKKAVSDNDNSSLGARGGSAFVANARNGLALFPLVTGGKRAQVLDDEMLAEAQKLYPELPKEGFYTLSHSKPTSSTKRGADLLLYLTDPGGDVGGQFQLPSNVQTTPEMTTKAAGQRADDLVRENQALRLLYREAKRIRDVEKKPITKRKLCAAYRDIGIKKYEVDKLIPVACSRNYLSESPKKCIGGGQEYHLGFDPDIGDGSAPDLE